VLARPAAACYENRLVAFAPGDLVAPNLRLSRKLAEGGMGSVWIADHLGLKARVAVKFISEASAADEVVKIRFSREATAAANIKSPHVVQIFDHGIANGQVPYIVMELLEGESLGDRLNRTGALELREVAAILTQLCRAVAKAHVLGIVHRDIKPHNIFLVDWDGDLFVKVLDFGVAKHEADESLSMTSTGMAVGTPHYMSPEQIVSSRNVTSATDLWAIGAVAYRCVTGRLPFQADSYGGLCIMINTGEFMPPTSLRPDLPPALDAWFARALERDPKKRFASAKELADQFLLAAGFAQGQVVSVPLNLPAPSSQKGERAVADPATRVEGSGTLTVAPDFPSSPAASRQRRSEPSIQGSSVSSSGSSSGAPQIRSRVRPAIVASLLVLVAIGAAWLVTTRNPPNDVRPAMAERPTPPPEKALVAEPSAAVPEPSAAVAEPSAAVPEPSAAVPEPAAAASVVPGPSALPSSEEAAPASAAAPRIGRPPAAPSSAAPRTRKAPKPSWRESTGLPVNPG
jgi:serine/threonine-protein kinase